MEARGSTRRARLGRRLSRRLSLVARVPGFIARPCRELTLIAPDKTQRNVSATPGQLVRDAVAPLLAEFSLSEVRLRLAGSLATADPGADVALLDGEILLVDPPWQPDPAHESDARRRLASALLQGEREHVAELRGGVERYGEALFPAAPLVTPLAAILNRLNETIQSWDPENSKIGSLFDDDIWAHYEAYLDVYPQAKSELRERLQDDDWAEKLQARRGATKLTLSQLLDLPVQRLAQYEHYFQAILSETRNDHPDHEELRAAKDKGSQAVKRGAEESDLERIQEVFPHDALRLHDRDALTMKMKGLIRKRSTTAARLQRALSARGPRADDEPPRDGPLRRVFLMEAPVHFSTGVQRQERHLFLFNDLLLVAKARSGGNFKLKDKVRVSEMWLAKCNLDVVSELHKATDTSFVMGWPTTNVVATFATRAARDLWWNKLSEVVPEQRAREPATTTIQVVYYDPTTSIEYCKTLSVSAEETATACVRLALEQLELRGCEAERFQLWARAGRDDAPYPLIGHERPFAIKLSCLRDALSAAEGFDLQHCNSSPLSPDGCQFVLRAREPPAKGKKARKSPMRIREVFRRSASKGVLFGLPLAALVRGEQMPTPVMTMLQQVFFKGPFTQGIFRKSANARLVRELRDKLDAGEDVRLSMVSVLVTASLLKEFLRSLPEPLLTWTLYQQWMEALEGTSEEEKLIRIKRVVDQLPRPNLLLLSLFVCVLHHIARRSAHTLMSAANLGVCVGPSLLWAPTPAALTPASSRAIPTLVELLVSRCERLLGTHVPLLLGEPDSGAEESDSLHSSGLRRDDSSIDSLERELMEPCPPPRKDKMSLSRDSGLTMSDSQLYTPDEEESGSTSSGSGRAIYPPTQNSCYDMHSHNKVAPSYSVPASAHPNESQQTGTHEYVRVYGGWEERVQECCRSQALEDSIYARPQKHQQPGVYNPNFQRQDWFRQRSHLKRLNSGGTSTPSSSKSSNQMSGSSSGSASSGVGGLHSHSYRNANLRRSASEESLLNEISEQNTYSAECEVNLYKRPALHRKGRAPPPPPPVDNSPKADSYSHYSPSTPITRSKSVHHLYNNAESQLAKHAQDKCQPDRCESTVDINSPSVKLHHNGHRKASRATIEDWSRSRSTPHIPVLEEIDRSYDSSTLSDDDSTPHVSRSNSRGKDCAAANSAWENAYGTSQSELIVHAAPINIQEESSSDTENQPKLGVNTSTPHRSMISVFIQDPSAPPLPPKRSSIDVKLRHLPPVHVDTVNQISPKNSQNYYNTKEENMQWENVDSSPKKTSESRGRLRYRDTSNRASQRSKSLPPPPGENGQEENKTVIEEHSEQPKSARSDISWSVSQLRTLFSNSGSQPPPYRPPPCVIPNHRAPITSYHLGDTSQSEHYVPRKLFLDSNARLRVDSTDEEESYV